VLCNVDRLSSARVHWMETLAGDSSMRKAARGAMKERLSSQTTQPSKITSKVSPSFHSSWNTS